MRGRIPTGFPAIWVSFCCRVPSPLGLLLVLVKALYIGYVAISENCHKGRQLLPFVRRFGVSEL